MAAIYRSSARTTPRGVTHRVWGSDPQGTWGATACGRSIDLGRATAADPDDSSLRWCRSCLPAAPTEEPTPHAD